MSGSNHTGAGHLQPNLPDLEPQFKALFECTLDAVLIADDNRSLLAANPAACMFLGRAEHELSGRRVDDLLQFGVDAKVDARLFEHIWGETVQFGHTDGYSRLFLPDFSHKDVEYRVNSIYSPGQHLFIIRDITERKRTETALYKSEARLNAFFDNCPALVVIKDADGRYVHFNKATERLVNTSLEELKGKTNFDRLSYETALQLRENDLEVLTTGEVREFVEVVERPDGEIGYWLTSKFLLEDAEKEKQVGVIAFDITESKRLETELGAAAALNLAILNSLPAQVAVLDKNGDIILVNRAWEDFARENGELSLGRAGVGDNYLDICRELAAGTDISLAKGAKRTLAGIREALAGTHPTFVFEYGCRSEAAERWFLLSINPLSTETGGSVVVHVDVTERRRTSEELRRSRQMLAQAEHLAQMGSWSWDITTNLVTWSDELYRILGLNPDEVQANSENYLKCVHPDDRTEMMEHAAQVVHGDRRYEHYYRVVLPDGTVRLLHSQGVAVRDENGLPLKLFGTTRDVTEIKRSEEERTRLFEQVSAGREQLQALSRLLVEVQETERRTIARELHDEVGQILTGLKLMLEMSVRQLPVASVPRLEGALSLVNDLMERVRELSLNLRPAMLDDLGLLPTLIWYLERYQLQTGIGVDFKHAGLTRRFASTLETAAYRIVQEALTNVARHAKVQDVTVRIWADQTVCSLKIEDSGAGFNVEAISPATSSGLAGMRERALLLQGNLSVESSVNKGTRIMAKLPIEGNLERREQQR